MVLGNHMVGSFRSSITIDPLCLNEIWHPSEIISDKRIFQINTQTSKLMATFTINKGRMRWTICPNSANGFHHKHLSRIYLICLRFLKQIGFLGDSRQSASCSRSASLLPPATVVWKILLTLCSSEQFLRIQFRCFYSVERSCKYVQVSNKLSPHKFIWIYHDQVF